MFKQTIFPCLLAIGVAFSCGDAQGGSVTTQGRNVTLYVTADTHFGYDSETTTINLNNIAMMNALPGTAYPAQIGGVVDTPFGVIVAGDLTQDGKLSEWNEFEDCYPLHGGSGTGQIHYPVYECTGNHDRHENLSSLWGTVVKREVTDRHGDEKYGFDVQGIQFYSVDQYPTESKCQWLSENLASIGTSKPVVLFFHFDMWDDEWWSAADRERFRQTIDGYNILCIIHGHKHNSFIYDWNGYDVFSPGSPKSAADNHSVGVLNITDNKLVWAEYSGYSGSAQITPHWETTFIKTIDVPEPGVCKTLLVGTFFGCMAKWISKRKRPIFPRQRKTNPIPRKLLQKRFLLSRRFLHYSQSTSPTLRCRSQPSSSSANLGAAPSRRLP